MCGVNAIADFSAPIDPAALQRMNDALAHRGPNGAGTYISQRNAIGLGSRRLSIVDVAGGAMPIVIEHRGTEYAIVSNGEFFNYHELRSELASKFAFKTDSDTEVALCAYIEWGERCVEKLHGQFAFVIYDGAKERLFIARDRFGIKPLYYSVTGSRLALSSEPKGLLVSGIAAEPDTETFASFFLSTFSIGKSEPSDRSFFAGIRALSPGAYAFFDRHGFRSESYFTLAAVRSGTSKDELTRTLHDSVVHAVEAQLPVEVPYGIALSGGLDSSIIASIASRSNLKPLFGVALRYDEGKNSDYDFASEMSQHMGMKLEAPVVTSEQLIADVDAAVIALDRPFESTRELGLFEIFRTLKNGGAAVALCGEGADEFNLGYYHALPGFDPVPTADELRAMLTARAASLAALFNRSFIHHDIFEVSVGRTMHQFMSIDAQESLDRMEIFYAQTLLKQRLDMADRLGMAHSLEVRVPYCAEDVVAASLAVPASLNLEGGTEKKILRDAFRDVLPPSIAQRRKIALPEATGGSMQDAIVHALQDEIARADGIWNMLNRAFVLARFEDLKEKPWGNVQLLGEPLSFSKRHLFLLFTVLRWYRLNFEAR